MVFMGKVLSGFNEFYEMINTNMFSASLNHKNLIVQK